MDLNNFKNILMTTREVYILSAVRTPIGSFGGALKDVPAPRLEAIGGASAMVIESI
jgi:acetyl-CoA C-acetyltransferase